MGGVGRGGYVECGSGALQNHVPLARTCRDAFSAPFSHATAWAASCAACERCGFGRVEWRCEQGQGASDERLHPTSPTCSHLQDNEAGERGAQLFVDALRVGLQGVEQGACMAGGRGCLRWEGGREASTPLSLFTSASVMRACAVRSVSLECSDSACKSSGRCIDAGYVTRGWGEGATRI